MSVRAIRNQYRGINAHLHSYWQGVGGWSRFHNGHINDIMRVMRPLLLKMGYDADVEPSVQIRRIDDLGDPKRHSESDFTIYDLDPARSSHTSTPSSLVAAGERVLSIAEALHGQPSSEKAYSAVKIYALETDRLARGVPVAWIELLSPSHKPSGRDALTYADKRESLIDAGLVFVELDYLHESPPTLYNIPNYRTRRGAPIDPDASPYRIAVIDPRPDIEDGYARVREFAVDTPIPIVDIPLNDGDTFAFDFGLPYHKTLLETLYAQELVDYCQLPVNFDRYAPDDQTRIARRMVAVCEAAGRGDDLEAGVLAVDETLDLAAALERLKAIDFSARG